MRHTTTISDLFQSELDRRLSAYSHQVAAAAPEQREAVREVVNHRYLCIQTAAYIESGGKRPAIVKEIEDVHTELREWMRELQRTANRENQYEIARTIATLTEWIERTQPITAVPAQQKLI
jgi:hypothetical protein